MLFLYFTFLYISFYLQTILSKPSITFVENVRAKKALEILRTKSCMELIGKDNCTDVKNPLPHEMQFFMASKNKDSPLSIVKVVTSELIINIMGVSALDAAVVIDPLPKAHHGHTTVVLPIKVGITKEKCEKLNGLYYPGINPDSNADSNKECMFLPNFHKCHLYTKRLINNMENNEKTCYFNSIPRIGDRTDGKNRLKCYPNLEGFGPCPIVKSKKDDPCKNKMNCQSMVNTDKGACYSTCDYALLLSGGWNKFTNKYRHLLNLRDMFRYLHVKKSFPKDNIDVFFANNSTIDLDGDKTTRDAVPATNGRRILNKIKSVCNKQSSCIDTYVLYLNGPTLQNGDILLWDKNKDGTAEESEIITMKNLIATFRICNAKNILIIADQNFAGHIIDEINSQREMGFVNMKTISVVTASTKTSYSWRRDFTTKFIEYDDVHKDSATDISPSRRISSIFKDLKKELSSEYKIKYLQGDDPDLTVTGKYGSTAGCKTNLGVLEESTKWEENNEQRQRRSSLRLLSRIREDEMPFDT